MSLNKLKEKLGVDETFTKPRKKQKVFNKIKNNIPHLEDFNFMADLLELPRTKEGFRYLLVIVDLFTDEFDIQPLKTKSSEEVLEAMMKIYKRKHLNKPYAAIKTDSGSEFKGVFHKWLTKNSIKHKVGRPGRHKQLANVEALNGQLGRLINGYLNNKEKELGETYREWLEIVSIIRDELNKVRKKTEKIDIKDRGESSSLPDSGRENLHHRPTFDPEKAGKPKYKIGDIVHEKLDEPETILGKKQPTKNFRKGDVRYSTVPKKVIDILLFTDEPYYRYKLQGINNATYSEYELIPSKEKVGKQLVNKLIDKRKYRGRIQYLVQFRGETREQASWEYRSDLIEDGLKDLINQYERVNKG